MLYWHSGAAEYGASASLGRADFPMEVRLLGQFAVTLSGTAVTIPSRPAQSLFAFLILNQGTSYRREKLAGLLWPEATEANARNYLRQALWRIRKVLKADPRGEPYLLVDEIAVAFNPSVRCWLDIKALEQPDDASSARTLEEAVAVYRGELLPGFYDEWVLLERERLQAVFERQMQRLLESMVEDEQWPEVVEWAERWITLGAAPEPAYRALMLAHGALGEMSKVASAYQRCVAALRDDLGVLPSEQTRVIYQRLSGGEVARALAPVREEDTQLPSSRLREPQPGPPKPFPESEVSAVGPLIKRAQRGLPTFLTSFIGRVQEMETIRARLSETRLLTLTGSGGSGKTRLALQVARQLRDRFKDGVVWVDLAGLSDPSLVPQAVASALDIREVPGQAVSHTLTRALGAKQLLLLLDNCEHLIEACAELTEMLLRSCPDLHVLGTSREALNIAGELTWTVPPLSVPVDPGPQSIEALLSFDAVRLFVERAGAASGAPQFALSDQNAASVVQVCQRLDGIPLAIELAAARAKVLTADEILRRLGDSLDILKTGSRTALPRHQTLRATLDWSYELLSEHERILFKRLSVFAGGWTLGAMEPVCTGGGIHNHEVLDLFTRLVDKSLVFADHAGTEVRYRMLETVREYASEKLVESREIETVRDRHLEFYLQLVEEAAPNLLVGAKLAASWEQLEAERDNFRAAIAWSLESGRIQAALRMTAALLIFWFSRGPLSEGMERLREVLSRPEAIERTAARAKALNAAVYLYWADISPPDARSSLEEALSIAEELADTELIATSLRNLGLVINLEGDYEAARSYLERSRALAKQLGAEAAMGNCLSLVHMAEVALNQKDLEEAEKLYRESTECLRNVGEGPYRAYAVRRLGELMWHKGRVQEATALCQESLAINQGYGDLRAVLACLAAFGGIALTQGEPLRAAVLLGAAEAQLTFASLRLLPADKVEYERNMAALRAHLDQAAFAAACAEGAAMSLEQALRYALEEISEGG